MTDRVFRVIASYLNLRVQPTTNAEWLVRLPHGQAVARLDDVDWEGWWYVFADTPGAGVYVGYVHSDFLEPWEGDGFVGAPARPAQPTTPAPAPSPTPVEPVDDDDIERDLPARVEDEAPPLVWRDGWNPAVPMDRRYEGRHGERQGGKSIERVIVHITGERDLARIVNRFTTQPASAHYLIDREGRLHQFVSEDKAAWHAGINRLVKSLYKAGDGNWRKYKRFFDWSRDYPRDAVFVDSDLKPVARNSGKAALVMRADGAEWPDYAYFDKRWGRKAYPIGFQDVANPNYNSIGIELLGYGSKDASPSEYTDAMYATLGRLLDDICARHHIEKKLGPVCGHEDVNPVERWGWDPNAGFDWSRALSGGAPGA